MRYVWRNGDFYDSDGNRMEIPKRDGLCMPMMQSDLQEYESPASGKMITSRSAQRDDLKRHDCVISDKPRQKFDPEEYKHRKAQQAKMLERRKAGLV